MIKLIAADMDGTLLNSKHEISKENRDSINKAKENGIVFSIATGRRYEDVLPVLKENNIKCQCIVMNGGEYRDEDGKILDKIYLPKEKAREVLDIIKVKGLDIEIYTDRGLYSTNSKEEAIKQTALRIMATNEGVKYEDALKIAYSHSHFKELNYITDIDEFLNSDINIGKFVMFFETVEETNNTKEALKGVKDIAVSGSFGRNIEINHVDAQKGFILSKVIEKLGFNKEEVAVMGDSYNDYTMFTEFIETYAMGNAVEDIKNIAKYITDTCDNGGVSKAIEKIIIDNK